MSNGKTANETDKVFYIWKPDLKKPKDKNDMHIVELLRNKPKRGEKIDRRWLKVREIK